MGESRIKLGLRLEESQTLKVNDTVLVIGRIEQILVAEDAWVGEDGYLDIEAAGTVAVSGLTGITAPRGWRGCPTPSREAAVPAGYLMRGSISPAS